MQTTQEDAAMKRSKRTKAPDKPARRSPVRNRSMSETEYRAALEALGMSIFGAGKYWGVSGRASQRFAAGGLIPDAVIRLVRIAVAYKIPPDVLREAAEKKLAPRR